MSRFAAAFAPLPKLALGAAAALAAITLSPGSAQAYVVTVGGTQYDVTTFTGSYNDHAGQFATLANDGLMPWWGNESAAIDFAAAVGNNLGTNFGQGPYFGFNYYPSYLGQFQAVAYAYYNNFDSNVYSDLYSPSASVVWAQVRPPAPPATPSPGPLPLLGAGAALGFSRKLRKRIKLAPAALASALPLA